MNVIKRNGSEVTFDKAKIENAIIKCIIKTDKRALQPMAQEHLKVWRNFHDVMNWSRENQIEEGSEHP